MSKDLLRQSISIITQGAKDFGAQYGGSFNDLKDEAATIRSNVSKTTSNANETFARLKSKGLTKMASDWFYQKESETENYDSGEDEFDSGAPDNDFDDDGTTTATSSNSGINADEMRDITRGQMNAIYGSIGRLAEINTGNTAQIITSIDTRSSEITASLNNVNTTLSHISSQFDVFMKYHVSVQQALQAEKTQKSLNEKNGIVTHNGQLSISNIFDVAKNNIKESASILSLAKTMLTEQSPSKLVSDALTKLASKIKMPGTDQTIDAIGKKFNATLGSVTQNFFAEMITAPWFKKVFGDMTKGTANKNYGKLVVNSYTTQPASFDGMTRMSIINVIPEYLKKINEAISGEVWSVSSSGTLQQGPTKNTFNHVAKAAFQSSGINYDTQNAIRNDVSVIDKDIPQQDIDIAGRALMSAYVMYLHSRGITILKSSQLSPNDMTTIRVAINTLRYATGKNDDYWGPICMAILQRLSTNRLEADTFVQNVNTNLKSMDYDATKLKSMDYDATKYTKTNPFAYRDAGTITQSIVNEQFKKEYGNNTDTKQSSTKIIDSQLGSKNKDNNSDFNTIDYMRGTFDILNRGINVRVTNDYTTDNSGFERYILRKSKLPQSNPSIANTIKEDSDVDPDSTTPYLDEVKNALIPKSIRTSMQFFGGVVDNAKGATNEVKNKFNEKAAENNGNNIFNSIKNFLEPSIDKITKFGNKATDKILGNKVTDMTGTSSRRGGMINNIKDKAKDIVTSARDTVQSAMDNHVAKREYDNIVNDVKNNTNDISEADKIAAQNVFALMQTAAQDGETDEDVGPIMNAIGEIKDDQLRTRISTSVQSMLKRSQSKSTKKSSGILSKIFTGGKLLLTTIFSPIITAIKGITLLIKNIGKKLFGFLSRMMKDGAITTKVGIKNMGRSLFGQREKTDEDGNVIQEERNGIFSIIKTQLFDEQEGIFTKLNKKLLGEDGIINKIGNKLFGEDGLFSKIKNSKLGQTISGIKTKLTGKNKTDADSENTTDGDSNNNKKKLSGFMKGFSSVFAEARTEKEKSRMKNMEITTVSDRESTEMSKMITGEKESLLSKISKQLSNIFTKISNGEEETFDTNSNSDILDQDATENREKNITMTAGGEAATLTGQTSPAANITMTAGGKAATAVAGEAAGAVASGGIGELIGQTSPAANITMTAGGKAATAVAGEAAGAVASGGIGELIGQFTGGFSASIVGLLQMIATAIMGLEGVKALGQLLPDLLNQIVEPLNKIFFSIIKLIQPVLDIIGGTLGSVVDLVSTVISTLIKSLMPLIEMITDVLSPLIDILNPIMEMLTSLITNLMAPLVGIVQFRITPILRQVGNTLDLISGILQTVGGAIQTILGSILTAIGMVINAVTFGFGGSELIESGKTMVESGAAMTVNGVKTIGSSAVKLVAGALDPLDITGVNSTDTEKTNTTTEQIEKVEHTGGSAMDGIIGSGDTNTSYYNTDDHSIHNIYGSGNNNQGSFGHYMNMDKHGCGPLALADAYQRRTGNNVNPTRVASSMMSNGRYDPNRGTSVAGFIQSGNAAGMNLKTGKVTRQSLKSATPNNPVTVVGSGPDFATKSGNIHYMNVIGSDKAGAVYVSNPITGGVKRRPMNSVVSGSLMGLYGSGDYDFDDSVTEAMSNLTSITDSLFNIFTGPSTEDKVQDSINAEKDKEAVKQAQLTLGDDFAKYEATGYTLFQKDYPKRDGETDEQYQVRYEKVKDKYTTLAAKDDIVKSNKAAYDDLNKSYQDSVNKVNTGAEATYSAGKDAASKLEAENSSSDYAGNGGEFVSDDGVKLGITYTPKITKTEIDGSTSDQSILHEFFKNTSDAKSAYSWDYGWYGQGSSPNKDGKGSSGRNHGGVDIIYSDQGTKTGCEGGFPIISTVDGNVVYTSGGSGYNNGLGNSVNIKDNAGNIHRFMHMASDPKVKKGDKVTGGKTQLGIVGTTGASSCYHLHYDIGKGSDGGPPSTTFNPHTFFKYKAPAKTIGIGKKVAETAAMKNGDAWSSYSNKKGVDTFIQAAEEAGMQGPEIATLMSTGIWEDGGEKIFGIKNLESITHDVNGQAAKGIMNWVDTDEDYGDTVLEQLEYIHDHYFDESSSDWRAKTRNDKYYKDTFKDISGYDFKLGLGSRYGPYTNKTDIVEGSTHFFGDALVPESFTNGDKTWMSNYIGTAVGAYNWMIDKGYIKGGTEKQTTANIKEDADANTIKTNQENASNALNWGMDTLTGSNNTDTSTSSSGRIHGGTSSSGRIHGGTSGRIHGGTSGKFDAFSGITGSGDIEDDFPINDYINNGANIINTDDGSSIFADNNDLSSYSENIIPTVITNKYLIKADDSIARENLRVILSNTYNVRAERVEALLEKLIELMNNSNNSSSNTKSNGNNNSPLDLFDDNKGVPSQVSKLSIG